VRKRSISDSSESQAGGANAKTRIGRLTRIRFIKVKEIHPDAPEPRVIHKHDENGQRKFEPPKTDVNKIKPEGILRHCHNSK
jgi:hypothetical protein